MNCKKVKCAVRDHPVLTFDKVYEVLLEGETYYAICNNIGSYEDYRKNMFR